MKPEREEEFWQGRVRGKKKEKEGMDATRVVSRVTPGATCDRRISALVAKEESRQGFKI